MNCRWFSSLQARLLTPLLAAALLAAVGVALLSASLGNRWALESVADRFAAIRSTLRRSSFPLTPAVLDSLASLTQTELVTVSDSDRILAATIELNEAVRRELNVRLSRADDGSHQEGAPIELNDQTYLLFAFPHAGSQFPPDRVEQVWVLFDQEDVEAASRRAAMLPLWTGLSTIILLTTLTLVIARRLVLRIVKLQQRLGRIAAGDFDSTITDRTNDEVGQLHTAIDAMSQQLKQLWATVNRQQSEKLLHQIAGGMAHQLRNTLTGSRMAMELHAQKCGEEEDEEVRVAIAQLEVAEDYVRRLLMVGVGQQEQRRPQQVQNCLDDIMSALQPVAAHLHVKLDWSLPEQPIRGIVEDGPTFSAAISNLILNAMQAGDRVEVTCERTAPTEIRIVVSDNGPGLSAEVAEHLFEPFVTTKPEGMGLGLPLVRRAAEHLDGSVRWERNDGWTSFEFVCAVRTELKES